MTPSRAISLTPHVFVRDVPAAIEFYRKAFSPQTIGDSPVLLLLEVEDVDDLARRAIFAGATVEMPVRKMFRGERYGVIRDPFGHRWALRSPRDEISLDDILRNSLD